jgi:hypothetical protein
MNRTLRRPMFRMGGSAGEGITSGLAPRQGYKDAKRVYEFDELNPEKNKQRLIELGILDAQGNRVGGPKKQSLGSGQPGGTFVGGGAGSTIGGDMSGGAQSKWAERMKILDTMYPRQKTDSMAGANFLMNWGVDLASRPRSGNIFQQAATSGKEPLLRFQEEKLMEQAAAAKETSEDRALLAKMLEGMDDDKLSALMKDVKAGVDAGLWTEQEGIKKLLNKKVHGVLDEPGEARDRRISKLEDHYLSIDSKSGAYAKAVAEHQYKMETGVYPKLVEDDLSQYPIYIKPAHKARDIKPEYDDQGQITKFVVQGKFARTYGPGIYFDPDTGNLFKRVSSTGEAPVFQRIDFE